VLNMAKNIRSKTPLVSTLTRATRLNDGHIETVLGHYYLYPVGSKIKKNGFAP
jgi:hypothetical protein